MCERRRLYLTLSSSILEPRAPLFFARSEPATTTCDFAHTTPGSRCAVDEPAKSTQKSFPAVALTPPPTSCSVVVTPDESVLVWSWGCDRRCTMIHSTACELQQGGRSPSRVLRVCMNLHVCVSMCVRACVCQVGSELGPTGMSIHLSEGCGAVVVAMHLTLPLTKVDRFCISFKTSFGSKLVRGRTRVIFQLPNN